MHAPLSIMAVMIASSAGSKAHCSIWRSVKSQGSNESGLMPILHRGAAGARGQRCGKYRGAWSALQATLDCTLQGSNELMLVLQQAQ